MSLLNDALRAAEQRQNRPEVAAAYTGRVNGRRPGHSGLWLVVLLLVASLGAVAVVWLLNGDNPVSEVAGETGDVSPVKVNEPQPKAVVRAPETISAQPAKAPSRNVGSPTEHSVGIKVAASASEGGELPSEPESEVVPEPAAEPEVVEPAPTAPARAQVSREPEPALKAGEDLPAVKQVRETPEAVDRRISQELVSLLGDGEVAAAEQRLRALVASQAAPASREVFARQMLVEGKPERALTWLPAEVTADAPDLRLLRARALHATGDLAGALTTLERSVPPVADNAGYRVTLATLLQQAGRSAESARHWSLLIAEDDSRAAWWVGLGIALESGGERDSAARAYLQAAQLPGLSPSLADYVRERLISLQAG